MSNATTTQPTEFTVRQEVAGYVASLDAITDRQRTTVEGRQRADEIHQQAARAGYDGMLSAELGQRVRWRLLRSVESGHEPQSVTDERKRRGIAVLWVDPNGAVWLSAHPRQVVKLSELELHAAASQDDEHLALVYGAALERAKKWSRPRTPPTDAEHRASLRVGLRVRR